MERSYFLYILASKKDGVLYIGVTNSLRRRIWQHRHPTKESFTQRYNVDKLVYYEEYSEVIGAISRETLLKRWKRDWKIRLIEKENPNWEDLAKDWFTDEYVEED